MQYLHGLSGRQVYESSDSFRTFPWFVSGPDSYPLVSGYPVLLFTLLHPLDPIPGKKKEGQQMSGLQMGNFWK